MAKRKKKSVEATTGIGSNNALTGETATGEPSAPEVAAVADMVPLQIPEWYASGAQLVVAGNDAQLIFNKPQLLGQIVHGVIAPAGSVGINLPVGMVRLSLATLNDLSMLLSMTLAKREAETGVIETDYTRKLAIEASASKKRQMHEHQIRNPMFLLRCGSRTGPNKRMVTTVTNRYAI